MQCTDVRHNWTHAEVKALFEMPFNDLLFKAASLHRANFNPNEVQISTLLSIKTGACPEDCKYCPQSAHYKTDLERERLIEVEKVVEKARLAKQKGATRFCMGAAWSDPKDRDMPYISQMVKQVKELGLETCMTLGKLSNEKAHELSSAGLDYYNHNLDTSAEYYEQIISTRTFEDRLNTISHVRDAGMKVCSGGIVGMGEQAKDRYGLLMQLANLPQQPESVPINMLVKVKGTPLENVDDLDNFDFIRTIACARIMMPKSYVRLSAGRNDMNEQMQSLCFFAGANSIFYGDKLLTTDNPEADSDMNLIKKLGMNPETRKEYSDEAVAASISSQVADKASSQLFYPAS
ncbi:biotin synthase BioB [Pseudoalteromonas sp. MMG010]|uniref:biotin synthase BioB n=1 Tax=Pseudoalteromonas sp. MMG010 TaxID=2822685 RepID=UPI001B3A082B|nr:biotin synthase BioB [Pseudoalteromonas sp. MMG010]MBQ4832398.1 biotin synthase BioB [Pseudoalteromonas sp. MMG010]